MDELLVRGPPGTIAEGERARPSVESDDEEGLP